MCVQSIAHFYHNTEQGRSVWWNLTVKLYTSILSFAQNVFHTVLLPLQNSDYIMVRQMQFLVQQIICLMLVWVTVTWYI